MNMTTIIVAVISGLGGGGLTWILTVRNLKVGADQDTISQIREAHERDVMQWTKRLQDFFDKVTELNDEMEDLHEEIVELRKMLRDKGIKLPPRRRRKILNKTQE